MIVGECARPEDLVAAVGDRPAIAHDAKALGQVPTNLAHDTEVAAYLLEPARRAYPFRELCEERGLATDVEEGPGADARLMQALADWQREEIRGRGLTDLLEQVELPIVRILREMEQAGVKLDTDRLHEISERVKAEADTLEAEIYELAGEEFTLGSPRQLEEVLFSKLGLSRKRRGKTGYSTDARVLQAIRSEHEIIPKIERWRELTKLAQTYLDALPLLVDSRSRLHTTFNQTAATTGRLSSNNPNLQNIPIRTELGREIRACFIAEPGNLLVSADYSQVELRLLAHIAGEDVLKDIFRRGEDVHTATACRVFGVTPDQIDPGMRSKSKMINYGIVYGLSAYGMADRLDIPQDEADEFIQRYLAGFPAVGKFIEETIEQGTEHGYVSTLFGRRRQVPELRARRWELRKQGERFAVNMVIQGTAADIMKVAMVRCDKALREAELRDRAGAADPRRAAVRGSGGRGRAGPGASRCGRWPPPMSLIRRWPWRPGSARTGCRPSRPGGSAPRPRGAPVGCQLRWKMKSYSLPPSLALRRISPAAVLVGAGSAGDRQGAVAGVVERALDGDLAALEERRPQALPDALLDRQPGAEPLVVTDLLVSAALKTGLVKVRMSPFSSLPPGASGDLGVGDRVLDHRDRAAGRMGAAVGAAPAPARR